MSEVKVNKISPRTNCGTVTLGDSGDTITIPAGATITNSGTANGFGATGAVNWQTTVKTSTFTAVAGEGYFVNTTSGAITVNLPAGTAGAIVGIKDYAGTFDTNSVTVSPNGSDKIAGVNTSDGTLDTEGLAVSFVFVDSTQGWLITDSGLQSDMPTARFITATGGTITTCGDFKIHTFTSPGTFCVSCAGDASGSNTVDYLVVAGGGGGGGYGGSGGGAGGFRLSNDTCMPSPLTSPLANPSGLAVPATSYPITVGAGGSSGSGNSGGPGSDGTAGTASTFSSISSAGGAKGRGFNVAGATGGSGSGGRGGPSPGGTSTFPGGAGNTPPVSPPQGNSGGKGWDGQSVNTQGGGGGGAGGDGSNAGPAVGGNGGVGSFVVQSGFGGCNGTTGPVSSTRYFSGGGGGGSDANPSTPGTGGSGGGGAGAVLATGSPAVAGTTNSGGGGGGGGPTPQTGGNGGSGIVIIRYKFQ